MSSVNIIVNDKSYAVACEEGQEERVKSLGAYIDKRVKDIFGAGAAHNESQLMVLTSLIIADELFELQEEVRNLKSQLQEVSNQPIPEMPQGECIAPEELDNLKKELLAKASEKELELAYSISEIAEDIQGLAKRLKSV
jgi:cell division protein ZapA